MSVCTESYNYGYNMGRMVGRLEVYYDLVKIVAKKVLNNYEEIMKYYKIPDNMCARLMDYLPIRPESWQPVNDEDWIRREPLVRAEIREEESMAKLLSVLKKRNKVV